MTEKLTPGPSRRKMHVVVVVSEEPFPGTSRRFTLHMLPLITSSVWNFKEALIGRAAISGFRDIVPKHAEQMSLEFEGRRLRDPHKLFETGMFDGCEVFLRK